MSTFVNPIPNIPVRKLLAFDFPVDGNIYRAQNAMPNVNPMSGEAPEVEDIYGTLGYPAKQQGFACMREESIEDEDPRIPPYSDLIVDIDRHTYIYHTARLSGSFVKYLIQENHKSIVKMTLHPLTSPTHQIISVYNETTSLITQSNSFNQWFWLNPATRQELLYTARADIDWNNVGAEPGFFKLVINWEFWDESNGKKERLPMSGFTDDTTFELSHETVDL